MTFFCVDVIHSEILRDLNLYLNFIVVVSGLVNFYIYNCEDIDVLFLFTIYFYFSNSNFK